MLVLIKTKTGGCMKQMITLFIGLSMLILPLTAQTVIFSEDFESGTPSTEWQQFKAGEEPIQAVAMSSVPNALTGGGSYVGMISDADISNAGAAYMIAGDTSMTNYTIEADVYCYVDNANGSSYTGLIAYGDSSRQGSQSHGFVYKFVADFDASARFRLYNNQLDMTIFNYTFHEGIDATGLYGSNDAWHHMKLSVQTDGDSTRFSCFFDGNYLGSYADGGADQVGNGQFGLWAFQNNGALAGYFDNIVVTTGNTSIGDKALTPSSFALKQNYPNPFNPTTSIEFTLNEGAETSLDIFNIKGELVNNIVNGYKDANQYSIQWNGQNTNGKQVPAGVYIYTLNHGQKSQTKKMIFLK